MKVDPEILELACRAVASDHYSKRFDKPPDDPHVLMNVAGNWNIFSSEVELALIAVFQSEQFNDTLTNLQLVQHATFGELGGSPDIYADYDKLLDYEKKMHNAVDFLRTIVR